ncbi:MAG: hypothetical protein KAJ52_04645 [Sedimentisphaerales bacterium]|nr:hypothetical protein [Sedimentisphaerales bacterium]
MSEQGNKSRDVAATVNRLRMLQVDLADESDQVRREQFSEVIQRALAEIVPEQRQAFLEELRDRFPNWDTGRTGQADRKETIAAPEMYEDLDDPDFLIEKLTALATSLSDDKKQSLSAKLKQSGLLPPTDHGWSDQCYQRMQKMMPGVDTAAVDPERFVETVALLFDFAVKLDPLVWSTWRKVAPRSSVHASGDFKESLLKYLQNKEELSECREILERLRFLIAGIISAFGQTGSQFSRYYMSKFSPSQIEALVDIEKRKIWVSREVKCWEKYVELARSMNDTSIEREFMDQITHFAETLMRGR